MSQNMTEKIFYVLFALLVAGLIGCAEEQSEEPVISPKVISPFFLYPNDPANNDSASAYISEGTRLLVHPKVSYKLSFEKDPSIEGTPVLDLFRLTDAVDGYVTTRVVRTLKPKLEGGRYVYEFFCEELEYNTWATTLVLDGELYKGTTRKARLIAEGPYSDTLSLNLIVAGKVEFAEDGMTVEKFARLLLDEFRTNYTSITVDTVYVRYAHEHPTLGSKYPANEPWIAGKSSDDFFVSELGGWPERGVKNALDIVLVHRIEQDWVLGLSPLYGGSLQGGGTVVIGAYSKSPTGEVGEPTAGILSTTLHETGHFFGLRHTTSTQADFDADLDYSNYEDGFDDTPYCIELLTIGRGLLKSQNSKFVADYVVWSNPRVRFATDDSVFDTSNCPDERNMMFPAVAEDGQEGFSAEQLEHVRKTLMILPH